MASRHARRIAWRRARASRRSRSPPELALPRRVERTVLYRTLLGHVETFLSRAAESGREVPRFVEGELHRFLDCGIPAHGFLRVHCSACGHDRLVPFSCKGRGFCPSCGGRRMAERAAHLVDRVLPLVPARQWVLSLPFGLRFRLAWDHRLLTAVLGVALRAILGCQRRRARRLLGVADGRCGAVTVVQRFGGSLNLNVHLHCVVLDGVHVVDERGQVDFHHLPPLTGRERLGLADVIAHRVRRLLERRGLLDDDMPSEAPADLATACQAASLRGVAAATGRRAGRRVRRIRLPALERAGDAGERRARHGFDLHVGPVVPARDRKRLERLCRYVLRPPLASDRLHELPDGRLRYELRHAWRDGTTAVELEPSELIERLVALVPAPRANLVRYHGTLAPGSRLRSRIVPAAGARQEGCCRRQSGSPSGPPAADRAAPAAPPRCRVSWPDLMRRVFDVDVLQCPRCRGRLRIVAAVTAPGAIRAVLECLGLPARPPPLAPAREPEQPELDFWGE